MSWKELTLYGALALGGVVVIVLSVSADDRVAAAAATRALGAPATCTRVSASHAVRFCTASGRVALCVPDGPCLVGAPASVGGR